MHGLYTPINTYWGRAFSVLFHTPPFPLYVVLYITSASARHSVKWTSHRSHTTAFTALGTWFRHKTPRIMRRTVYFGGNVKLLSAPYARENTININVSARIDSQRCFSLSPQEALQCVNEINCPQLLFVFVQFGLESTLERNTVTRENLGRLLHQLIKTGTLLTEQYFKGSVGNLKSPDHAWFTNMLSCQNTDFVSSIW